jgi:hypothetical protein
MSKPLLDLSSVTLLCVETRDPKLAHFAIQKCTDQARFSKVVLITDLAKVSHPQSTQGKTQQTAQGLERLSGIEYVQAPPIKTTKDYSHFLLTGLRQYVSGTHVLVIQWDSFIIHPELWTDDFLKYDYIGAVWPHHPETPVGNGGFSLRSTKLLDALASPNIPKRHPEDFCICIDNRGRLENEFGIRFAPTEVAEKFAVERSAWHPAFGFHGLFNFAKAFDSAELTAFLRGLSDDYLSGVDAYDLIDDLIMSNRLLEAQMLRRRVQFSWKWRKRFVKAKMNLFLAKREGGRSQP